MHELCGSRRCPVPSSGGVAVTNLPFGFNPSGGSNDPDDLAGKIPLFAELQKLLSWSGGPVNWDLARQIALSGLAGSHRSLTAEERTQVADAIRLADLWLDEGTAFPSGVTSSQAWSRADWIERTQPVWEQLCNPVASRVVGSMSAALPEEARSQMGPMAGVMGSFGGLLFGAQVGQGLGALSQEVVSSTDIGLPLGPAGTAVLLPENVSAFGDGLERPDEEIRLYLALREAAHHRLFGHVPWLRQRLLDTVEAYARGIEVDASALQQALTEIDPTDPESMQRALSGGMFEPQETPQQRAAVRRLETLLALVEGWVDTVVASVAEQRMPGAGALREASRRRRASGGPAEQTFSTLVGLELRPRRLREAATLWWAVTQKHGMQVRDEVWASPELLPDAEDLDNPLDFAETVGVDALAEFRSDAVDSPVTDEQSSEDDPSATDGGSHRGDPEDDRPTG